MNALQPSINRAYKPLLESLIAQASALNIKVSQHVTGATIIDAGIELAGSAEAGRQGALPSVRR
jgi:methenyltetrahydromethanopterin cyclohydrolase